MADTNNGAEPNKSTLVLHFDRATFALHVDGTVVNYDEARAILAQADRYFEQQQRTAAALALQEKLKDAQANAALRSMVTKNR